MLLALAVLLSNLAQSPDASGQGWSIVRMDLEVRLDPAHARFELESRLRLRLDRESSLGPTLGMNVRAPVLEFRSVEAGDAKVELNALTPLSKATRLAHVRYASPKKRGDEIEVIAVTASTGRSSQLIVDESFALASWVEGWYPIPLPGNLDAFTPRTAAASGRTTVLVPPGWTAVSNGKRTERADGRAVWESSDPVARSFAAGPLEESEFASEGTSIRVFRLAAGGKKEAGSEQAQTLGRAVRAMEKRFGRYPFPTYSIVEAPDALTSWYAASEQGFIIADSAAFGFAGGNLPLFAHEAAHGWWGNVVDGSGPGGILCEETLAQYSAVIAIEEIEGIPAATEFLCYSRFGYSPMQCAKGYFAMWRAGNDKALAALEDGPYDHDLSDAKGHWMFHMLRQRVGDDVFFRTLRALIDDPAKRHTSLAAVRASFVAAAPGARLERFFADWLDRTGAPVLTLDWSDASRGSEPLVKIAIAEQGDPYDLDLDVEIEGSSGKLRHTIHLADARGEWTLASPVKPSSVALDPDRRLLIWTPEYGDRPSVAGK